HDRDGGRAELVPDSVADLLRRMSTFRTLAEHAQAIAEEMRLDEDEERELEGELGALVQAGFTYEYGAIARELAAGRESQGPAPIERICVQTCERTAFLGRAVSSILDACRRSGRTIELSIFDDSHTPEARRENRELLAKLAREHQGA